MKKTILNIAVASTLTLTGVSAVTINQPNVHASTKSFPKEVQGKWTNQADDTFKINDKKATLKIANGKKKGTYKFKLKSKIDEGYKLKVDGKKLDKTNDYTISIFQDGTMQFNYGKQTIKLSNGPVNAKKSSTSKTTAPTQNAKQTNNQQPNNQAQSQVATNQSAQQTQSTDSQDSSEDNYNNLPEVQAVRNSNPQEYAAEEARVANGTSCIANEPLLGEAQNKAQQAAAARFQSN